MIKVAVSKCNSYDQDLVNEGIQDTLNLIGIGNTFFSGKRVLIKPNLLGPFHPEQAATTHPSMIKGIVEIVRNAGGKPVIGESPGGMYRNASKIFKDTGVTGVAESTGTELIDLGNDKLIPVNIGGRFFETLYLPSSVLEADIIISLPKFKTHSLTTFTGATKNVFGVVPGKLKSEFHRKAQRPSELAEAIIDLFAVVRPQLSIMDAIVGMEGDGPSAGSPKNLGYIMASEDAVALDAVCVEMIGLRWDSVDMIKIASEKGLGNGDITKIEIAGSNIEEMKIGDFKFPQTTYLEEALNNWIFSVSTYDWLKPMVDERMCTGCTTCFGGCPVNAIEMVNNIPQFDYEKCIRCYCCQELCPEHAIELKIDRSKKVILKAVGGIAKISRLTRQTLNRY